MLTESSSEYVKPLNTNELTVLFDGGFPLMKWKKKLPYWKFFSSAFKNHVRKPQQLKYEQKNTYFVLFKLLVLQCIVN